MNYESYEDLNKAKARIMSLMKTKYGEIGEDYLEHVDKDADGQMNDIIKQLNDATSHSFNMIPFIKKEADRVREVATGNEIPVLKKNGEQKKNNKGELLWEDEYREEITPGNAYYRNVNSLLAFNQQVLNLSNALTSANRIFRKLIDDIGYVEPQTLDIYKQSYDKYMKTFGELNHIAVVNGQLKVIMKEGDQNEFDREQLLNEFNNARLESLELVKFNDVIARTYNYKSSTVGVKKNRVADGSSSQPNYLQNDDE